MRLGGDASGPGPAPMPPRRSKNGCATCRGKKVKCDEERPKCGRCARLRLACQWVVDHPPTLRERRRGCGPIRTREGWEPARITPRVERRGSPVLRELAAADVGDGSFCSVDVTVLGAGSASPVLLDLFQDSLAGFEAVGGSSFSQSNLDTSSSPEDEGTAQGSLVSTFTGHAVPSNPQYDVPTWEAFCAPWSVVSTIEFPIPQPPSPRSLPLPYSVPLTSLDHRALDHYSTTFSISFTKKHPKWSTLSMLRILGLGSPMVMHFLLAVSLNDLWWRSGAHDSELHVAAQKHYRSGARFLAEMMSGASADGANRADAVSHTHTMAAFWFLYLYKTKTPAVDVDFLNQLSKTVTEHILRHKLDELCSSSSASNTAAEYRSSADDAAVLAPSNCSARDGSLIALMIICLYYQDIKYGFYHCGGKLARYLNSNKSRLGRIYDLGRNALALNWGTEYPVSELVEDSENYSMLKFNSELNIVLEDLNREFDATTHDEDAEKKFRRELETLQVRYAGVFETAQTSKGSMAPRSRSAMNADLSTAYFYAVKIYLFRCTLEDPAAGSPAEIEAALNEILLRARRVLGPENAISGLGFVSGDGEEHAVFHRIEWPLFIAGVETKDVIYQDWILQKLAKRNTRVVLKQVLEEQARIGKRVGVEFMRQVFLQKGA